MKAKCRNCKVVKTLDNFYLSKTDRNGHKATCKDCARQRSRDYYLRNREDQIEYSRQWYSKNRAKKLTYQKKYNKDNQEKVFARVIGENRSIKGKARQALHYAIKKGELQRQPCEVCGEVKVDAHHHKGYEKQYWLDVKWLCHKHHGEAHRIALEVINPGGKQ